MEEGIEEYTLSGFDASGEPQIRRTATGRLWLAIEYLPPTWAPDKDSDERLWDGPWSDFDKRLSAAIGVPVVWEDKEWFRIDHPRGDTVEAVHRFLLAEKQRVIAERRCSDPVFDEVVRLDDALRRWKECSDLPPARETAAAPRRDESDAGAPPPPPEVIVRMKDRLRRLSPRRYIRAFPEEGWPKVEPGAVPAGPAFSPSWHTDTVVLLARRMHDAGDFGAMPILADALQDAGCEDERVLAHCRDATLAHVRGCWVVASVLGEE